MKLTPSLFGLLLVIVLVHTGGCASSQTKLSQEEVLEQYPKVAELDAAMRKARANSAELLAPESYSNASEALESAMDAARNNKQETANKTAAEGLKVVDKLFRDTATSNKLLFQVLRIRERAIDAGVINLEGELLTELDEELKVAAILIENGKLEKAKQRRPRLIQGYTALELATLKKGMEDLAKSAIASAREQGAKKYAPKTLAQAEEKLALAVSILDADRTQTDKADLQARNAKWLAERSAAITETIRDFDRRDYTMEDIVLWHQAQLSSINEPLGGELPLNKPDGEVVHSLRTAVGTVVSERNLARNQLKDVEERYDQQLAMTENEQQREQADRQKFEKVQAMFNTAEANVYRQRQNVLISAHGFQFPPGQSEIQTNNFPLMKKITHAIRIFPDSRIEVAGHTDATGAANVNLKLSEARAAKVGKFLADVGEIAPERIMTRGYGETRPVASNETYEGRSENRRVEIKIMND